MKTVVLMFGLASLCLLTAQDSIPVQPNFDVNGVAGKWFPIATTTLLTPNQLDYFHKLIPLRNGNLVLKILMDMSGTCRGKKVVFHPLRQGVFKRTDGKVTIHVVETDYKSFHITFNEVPGVKELSLFGRRKKVSEDVIKKFKNHAKEFSFDPEAIIYFACPSGTCTESSAVPVESYF